MPCFFFVISIKAFTIKHRHSFIMLDVNFCNARKSFEVMLWKTLSELEPPIHMLTEVGELSLSFWKEEKIFPVSWLYLQSMLIFQKKRSRIDFAIILWNWWRINIKRCIDAIVAVLGSRWLGNIDNSLVQWIFILFFIWDFFFIFFRILIIWIFDAVFSSIFIFLLWFLTDLLIF